ncbi:S-methyl-5-thioribose-1-phosphate isomerase [Aggregatilinea lenta]|uniref:S-methyl-5-thioribose-1-phosphate isomerase n=1 Tax=Aggregatilinea lenta TaxID=913108 RepID=UPI000E5C43AD|nr:S-methyl-5-thioribose-1-phosphate isomerase [Aggregatilinea lenta]
MRAVAWIDDRLRMIDQRQIPFETETIDYEDYAEVARAITDMVVRGAPAIGVSAAYGMALAARQSAATDVPALLRDLATAAGVMKAARPTAVNLAWAVDHVMDVARSDRFTTPNAIRAAILDEAHRMAEDDVRTNKQIGQYGAALIKDGDTILHHCNTGFLATVDYGTALGIIRTAHEQGKHIHVLLDETRPRLQGARLSAWECEQLGIPYDIIPDTAAGFYMRRGEINVVMFGADRVAANGDVVNKIGSYQIAVLGHENGIPVYSAMPISTVDLTMPDGDEIPIEERDPAEVRAPYGCEIVPAHFHARNPAFDVTPAHYLNGLVTECGVVLPPFTENLRKTVESKK